MNDVIDLEDHMSWVCTCGGVIFNLLKSRKMECCGCGLVLGHWMFVGSDALPREEFKEGHATPLEDDDV